SRLIRVTGCTLSSLFRNFDQQLPEIRPLQKADKSLRRILEAVYDILAIFELALADPGARLAQKILCLMREIKDDEALNAKALRKNRAHHHRCAVWAFRQ